MTLNDIMLLMVRREYRSKKRLGRKIVVLGMLILAIVVFVILIRHRNQLAVNSLAGDITQAASVSAAQLSAASSTPAKMARCREKSGVFEVDYPRNTFKKTEKDLSYPPEFKDKIKSEVLVYSLAKTATTSDLSLSFTMAQKPFGELYSLLEKTYGTKNLKIISIDGHQGVSFNYRAAGERGEVNYEVVPVDEGRTLFIAKRYEKPGQQKLLDDIMKTFSFQYSI